MWAVHSTLLCAQEPSRGQSLYNSLCMSCHGGDGNGGERAPGIVRQVRARDDRQLAELIRQGIPGGGMPAYKLAEQPMRELIAFLRSLRPARARPVHRAKIETIAGRILEGVVLNQSASEMQMQSDDGRLRLLRRTGDRYREVTSQTDWLTYNGTDGGNRYSMLAQITKENVSRLAPAWVFPLSNATRLEVTPVVVQGVMYVTAANECYALDAGSGRELWHYRRPRTPGVAGDAGGGINRGVAVSGDHVFMVTDHAHLIALNRFTGALLWDTTMADYKENYGATSAPLVAGGLVVSGHSGGDEGVRGFLAAFDRGTGKEVWRFWTVPKPGEPGSETWKGSAIEHGCSSTWLTGTYDPQLELLYWPTGNPCPDFNGDERKGDNLYSDSVVALSVKTGQLKWYYQFTPHDLWDWDAQQPPVLVDVEWKGRPRKLLLHANRNGFFYVLDRISGELLLGEPFVKKLTWASGIGKDGRPMKMPGQSPSPEGTKVCPAVEGATNWFSTSFHPGTGLYYVQALEKCNIFVKEVGKWEPGKSYYDGSTRQVPGEPGQKILRAIDIRTGKITWELPQAGDANTWGGTLATASGLVFFGDDSNNLSVADATTGKLLWSFPANHLWKASPMTYMFDRKQYVAVASGPNVIAFALVE